MSKYEPLGRYLSLQKKSHLSMTFAEIERIVGINLPPSKKHRAWWSNNPNNNVMTRQWLTAGYETESVDVVSERLVFRRVDSAGADHTDKDGVGDFHDLRDPLFGCMKGTMMIPVDLDLTAPADPGWSRIYQDG